MVTAGKCNAPQLIEHSGFLVVRDDLLAGGTKARVLSVLFGAAAEYVYASPVYGFAQIALAHVARQHGKRATIFCARRAVRHPRTLAAAAAGAEIVEIPAGYLNVVQARARAYCKLTGAELLPHGLDTPALISALAAVARGLPVKPREVWAVAGSGVLLRALQEAWPAAQFFGVRIGGTPDVGRARLYVAPEKFEQAARTLPPFPSCSNYDAKAWQFIRQHARPGALFWNVAG